MSLINAPLRYDKEISKKIVKIIHRYSNMLKFSKIKIMNFCGTHEWTTVSFGLRSLMPSNVELIPGPGCPVCITPSLYIEKAIKLSLENIRVYCFGDVFKVPSLKRVKGAKSLEEAKALGGNVKVVYSFLDAIKDAKKYGRTSVFLGIGFETTAPSYAIPILKGLITENLLLMSVLRLTPPAAEYAIKNSTRKEGIPVQGVIAPGHVSTIIGAKPWDEIARKYGIPSVVSGFEPLDVLLSVALILKMQVEKTVKTVIEYSRLVSWKGNTYSQEAIFKVFEKSEGAWRGLGFIPDSSLELKGKYKRYDAFEQLGLKRPSGKEWKYDLPQGCKCAEVMLGVAKPMDCRHYMKTCTPSRPLGPCMVSLEGTCAIWSRFGEGNILRVLKRSLG